MSRSRAPQIWGMSLILCAATLACIGGRESAPPEQVAPVATPSPAATPYAPSVTGARAFYAAQPAHLRPAPPTDVPAGLPDLKASTCGGCHVEIYGEWQASTHAQAWEGDPQFMAELHKEDPAVKDVRWMCVNCHTPMEGQLERLVYGLKDGQVEKPLSVDNPAFDPIFQKEAITCATCHVREGVVLGPYGDTQAPHPVRKDEALTTPETCTQCHQAQAEFQRIALACVFDTGAEHQASPQKAEGKTCQSCHMPEVKRSLTPFSETQRVTRRHYFGGSLIPKTPAMAPKVAEMALFYEHGMEAELTGIPPSLPPEGGPLTLTARYRNANAGHRLPTGDPERFIRVQLTAKGPDGAELGRAEARIGTVYEWWPAVKKLSDNRLAPGESRDLTLTLEGPLPERVEITLKASKWRISEENLAYHDLKGEVVPGIVFLEETRTLTRGP